MPAPTTLDKPGGGRHGRPMWPRTRALSVHALTATGAVFAMFALLAAVEADWSWMFLWLLAALLVDGIDGPLARRYDVKTLAARFDGDLLDLIIDYLTYVFIPTYALYASGLVSGWPGWGVLVVVPFASALYFADVRMKTPDASFEGFPGCWNMVALFVFVTEPDPLMTLAVAVLLSAAMFLPIRFVHPTRTERWRGATLAVTIVWMAVAFVATWRRFDVPAMWEAVFMAASAYLLLIGAAQQALQRRSTA